LYSSKNVLVLWKLIFFSENCFICFYKTNFWKLVYNNKNVLQSQKNDLFFKNVFFENCKTFYFSKTVLKKWKTVFVTKKSFKPFYVVSKTVLSAQKTIFKNKKTSLATFCIRFFHSLVRYRRRYNLFKFRKFFCFFLKK
jgi:hypothetical protein